MTATMMMTVWWVGVAVGCVAVMLSQSRNRQLAVVRVRGERGSISLQFAILGPILLFGFVGLVFDGGRAVNARATAGDVAQSAARAAANAVELTDDGVALNASDAVARGQAYLALHDGVTGTVVVTGEFEITVRTEVTYSPVILIPRDEITFTAEHVVEATIGVRDGNDV